jgi:hypothetical protein
MNMGALDVQNNGNKSDGNCPQSFMSTQRFRMYPARDLHTEAVPRLFGKFHICQGSFACIRRMSYVSFTYASLVCAQ